MGDIRSLDSADAIALVIDRCQDFSHPQLHRIMALLEQIQACEGSIPGKHWCVECCARWTKVWSLTTKFRALNLRRAESKLNKDTARRAAYYETRRGKYEDLNALSLRRLLERVGMAPDRVSFSGLPGRFLVQISFWDGPGVRTPGGVELQMQEKLKDSMLVVYGCEEKTTKTGGLYYLLLIGTDPSEGAV